MAIWRETGTDYGMDYGTDYDYSVAEASPYVADQENAISQYRLAEIHSLRTLLNQVQRDHDRVIIGFEEALAESVNRNDQLRDELESLHEQNTQLQQALSQAKPQLFKRIIVK